MAPRGAKSPKATRHDKRNSERTAKAGHRPKTARSDGAAATTKTRRMKGT